MGEKLFRSIDVWKTEGESLVRFRCFEVLGESRYYVQSKDFIHFPLIKQHLQTHERNFLELLIEDPPDERATFSTLEEAIADHEAAFARLRDLFGSAWDE